MPGSIDFRGDRDVFEVPVVAGHVYRATSTPTTRLDLVDVQGNPVGYAYPLRFYAATNDRRFVVRRSSVGPYALLVEDLGLDDHADTPAGATPLTLGTELTAENQFPMDRDAFKWTVIPGHRYGATCGIFLNVCNMTISAVSSTGAITQSGPFASRTSFLASPNQTEAVVSVETDGPGTFTLLVTDLGVDDQPDTAALATTELVTDGPPVTGSAEFFDPDAFFIDAAAGQVIVLTCTESVSSGCNLKMQPQNGAELFAYSYNTSPGVVTSAFFSPNAERWTVTVTSGLARVDYSLRATVGGDDSTAPRPITLGVQVTGWSDYIGDADDFTIQLNQGVGVTALFTGPNTIKVYSSSGLEETDLYDGWTFWPLSDDLYRFTVVGRDRSPYSLTLQ
jgi:hypothetical protein